MHSISPVSVPNPIVPVPAQNASNAAAAASINATAPTPPSTTLKLGLGADSPTYDDPRRTSLNTGPLLWGMKSNDPISVQMAGNYGSQSLAMRFQGLGAAMLNWIGDKGGNFSQFVTRTDASAPAASVDNAAMQQRLLNAADNQLTLDITTTSGAKVELTLASDADGLAVQVNTTNGTLNDTDRAAIAKLADAAQSAIDGLTAVPPQMNLQGLAQFDTSALSSVDLHANFKTSDTQNQIVDLHLDTQHRSLKASGAFGNLAVDVDMSNPTLLGSTQQQKNAIDNYVKQFEGAEIRGKGDDSLMTMFEDAFVALNSNESGNAGAQSTAGRLPAITLNDSDRSVLTGLADFTASVTQTPDANANPFRPEEKDTFSYDVSQHTQVSGHGMADRAVTQDQHSSLTASYHMALYPDTPMLLTLDPHSQNYTYTQIKDDADSSTSLAYDHGNLVKATLDQSSNQSTRIQKYVEGKLEDDLTTPSHVTGSRNLMGLLDAADKAGKSWQPLAKYEQARILATVSNAVLLLADPAQVSDAAHAILS
jgi:hypothetical protein